MKKAVLAFLCLALAYVAAYAQTPTTWPNTVTAPSVYDFGNGPIKLRLIKGNAFIYTSQGSGTGSTSGSSTALTLTATPTTAPCVGCAIAGTGITAGTTVSAYNGTTQITLSAAMTVAGGTSISWGAACPATYASPYYIQGSPSADYWPLYTTARICATSPGGPSTFALYVPYTTTSSGGGGSTSPGGVNGNVQYNNSGAFGGLTDTQLTARIAVANTIASGGVPLIPNTTSTFLRGDNSWQTLNCAALSGVAASCSTDTTNASNISSGTLAATRGGAGTINGALKGNGSGVVSQASCADLSGVAASCSTDTTNASNISSGTLNAARLPATATLTIASGTSAMGTSAISSATCATVVTTAATGAATTDAIIVSFNADPTAVTGYVPLTTGMLTIIGYPTSNNVNWKVCNNTGSSITPGAVTLNWRVVR